MADIHARAGSAGRIWSARDYTSALNASGAVFASYERCFAIGRCIADEAELLQIATDPAQQRSGLATRVLSAFEMAATQRAVRYLFLEVAQSNQAARALYERAGWRQTGSRKAYYTRADGTREDALLYSKALLD